MKQNYWLNQADDSEKIKELDDFLMEAWSNESNVGQILESMPEKIKEFFLKLNITCPDPLRNGLKIGFVVEKE